MTASPELETQERQGSRALGILGAFLGALLGDQLWQLLLFVIPTESAVWELTALLGSFLAGFCACWGYRLFRGRREMKFAWRTVRICVVLAVPPAIVLFTVVMVLCRTGGRWLTEPRIIWLALTRSVENLAGEWKMILILALMSLFFARLSALSLLKYADPGWYSDPRRIAQSGGNGATFNMAPCWPLPANENIPERFEVDKGKITVAGDIITVKQWGKSPRSFPAEEIAGVMLGTGSGFTVLYDKENRVLAKFGWSRKNAMLFGQYLLQCGVPFVTLGGQPVDTVSGQVELPRQFTVREGKLCLVLGWFGVVLLSVTCLTCLFLLEGGEKLLYAALAAIPLLALFVPLLLSYYNRRLEVDGTQLRYVTVFGRETRFRLSDVDKVKYRAILGTWELRDREDNLLARYEFNMDNADLMSAYLEKYQTQRKD